MKRTMKSLLTAVAASLLAVSCIINLNGGSWVGTCTEDGIDYTEVRDVAPFHALSASLPCNVYYVQADRQEVRVESTQEFAPKVLTEVEDGLLKLKLEEGRYPKLVLRVVVSSPDIESISVRGSGNLIHEGSLRASKGLSLRVSGSGDILAGDIDSRDFDAHVSGSGTLRIANLACRDIEAHVSGSGSEHIGTVTCTGIDASVSGSGHIVIDAAQVDGDVQARISGSGRIRFEDIQAEGDMDLSTSGSGSMTLNGSCHEVNASTTGAGSISGNLTHTGIRTHTSGSGRVNL
jgi:hypothetical protein